MCYPMLESSPKASDGRFVNVPLARIDLTLLVSFAHRTKGNKDSYPEL